MSKNERPEMAPLLCGVLAVAVGVGTVMIAARKAQVSLPGWLMGTVIVPLLYRKRKDGTGQFEQSIAENRAAGPALPTKKDRSGFRFVDETFAETRVFRLAPTGVETAKRAIILYLHGGAYTFDFMPLQWRIVRGLVERTGAEVVSPIYPLAPENGVQAGLDAVEKVYAALVEQAGRPVAVCGDSAGGGLALALAHRLRDRTFAEPSALVLFYPWLDVTVSGPDQPNLEACDRLLSAAELRQAGLMWAHQAPPSSAGVSPLFGNHEGLPPTLMLTGTHDILLSDSRRLKAAWPKAILHEYPGMFHGFVCAPIPEADRALDEAAAFISNEGRDSTSPYYRPGRAAR